MERQGLTRARQGWGAAQGRGSAAVGAWQGGQGTECAHLLGLAPLAKQLDHGSIRGGGAQVRQRAVGREAAQPVEQLQRPAMPEQNAGQMARLVVSQQVPSAKCPLPTYIKKAASFPGQGPHKAVRSAAPPGGCCGAVQLAQQLRDGGGVPAGQPGRRHVSNGRLWWQQRQLPPHLLHCSRPSTGRTNNQHVSPLCNTYSQQELHERVSGLGSEREVGMRARATRQAAESQASARPCIGRTATIWLSVQPETGAHRTAPSPAVQAACR